jgi:hypothetical protein
LLLAQMTAALIQRFMRELGLSPYIRRFKNEAGCTVDPCNPGTIVADFDSIDELIAEAFNMLRQNQEKELVARRLYDHSLSGVVQES